MKIYKSTLPEKSALNDENKTFNYMDSFEGLYIDKDIRVTSTDIGKAFFASGPKWVEELFLLRNRIAALFGLKISGSVAEMKKKLETFNCEPGELLGLFKVYSKSEDEVVLGEDDKHLNFRVSLFSDKRLNENSYRKLTITTTVEFNNWFGRLYFTPVRLFHKLIVPTMLKGIIVELQNNIKENI
jgi:hypothetical protein